MPGLRLARQPHPPERRLGPGEARGELQRVKDDGTNPLDIGFTARDVQLLLAPKDPTATEPKLTGLTFSVIIRCESEEHQGEVLRMLEERGLECEAMIS